MRRKGDRAGPVSPPYIRFPGLNRTNAFRPDTSSTRQRSRRAHVIGAIFAFLGCLIFSSPSSAITIILSDFDDTIVETRQSRQGTFETTFTLFRIERRSNMLQNEPEGPLEIEVTPNEFKRIKDLLGKGNGEFGAVGMKVTLKSGQVISPGNYMVRDPETFRRFNSSDGRNFPLEDFKSAEERTDGTLKGEFFDKMAAILSNPEWAKSFGIITARGHVIRDWQEFFEYLKKRGYIEHLPNFNLIHNVSLPEYDRFGIQGDISTRKIALLEEKAMRMARVPLSSADERLHPNGKSRGKFHYLIFADDNTETIKRAFELFQRLAQGKRVPIKFALFNTGTETEVKESGRPRYTIIGEGGQFRRATALEMIGEPADLTEEQAKELFENWGKRCEDILMGRTK